MQRLFFAIPALLIIGSCGNQETVFKKETANPNSYTGPFMGSPLELELDSLRGDSVFGISRHRDQERALKGMRSRVAEGYRMLLTEPGDSPYDGTYELTLDTAAGTMSGSWKPINNAELSETAFTLERKQEKMP